MKTILSIQSHVAFGYVGNRAAVFPLQRMGYDVSAVHTVQFSNHTGYGSWTGEIFSAENIRSVIKGLQDRGLFASLGGILSGYLGDASLGEVVFETVEAVRRENPNVIYCCDPVMGDVGRGLFVKPNIPDVFRDRALALADILTPNLYELEVLTGTTIKTMADARSACHTLHARGVKTVLVTSLILDATPHDKIEMLASCHDGSAYIVQTPRLDLQPAPNGSGDLTAALFLGNMMHHNDVADALARTAEAVFATFETTARSGTRELALIMAQEAFVQPQKGAETPPRFRVMTPT